jgi:hypothetical protein
MQTGDVLELGSKVMTWAINWAYTTQGMQGVFLFLAGFITHYVYSAVSGKLWKWVAVLLVVVALLYAGYSITHPGGDINTMVYTVTNMTQNFTQH